MLLAVHAACVCRAFSVVHAHATLTSRARVFSALTTRQLPAKPLSFPAPFSSWENTRRPPVAPTQAVKTEESIEAETAKMASGKIQLYSLATPNGMKVGIALEEMGLEYDAHLIDIMNNDQFTPEFLAVNPNGKIPAMVDPSGPDGKPLNVFESGAILLYLAEKTGKFLSPDPRLKWETIQWLFFQMGGVGPMFGQFGHFFKYAKEKCQDPYPVTRYTNETKRLLGVLEKRLEGRDFLVDSGYSIADMATFPWVHCIEVFYGGSEAVGLNNFPKVMAWKERCSSRPATAKGMTVCKKQ